MRVRKRRTERGTGVETETRTGTETETGRERMTNAGMLTVDQGAVQLAAHAAEAIQGRGGAEGSQTVAETALFHLPSLHVLCCSKDLTEDQLMSLPSLQKSLFLAHLHILSKEVEE